MANTYDREASKRRIAAYTDFLMEAYGTDADGLADIAGIDRDEMADYVATTDYGDLDVAVLSNLGNMTGISFSWLFAESKSGEPAGRTPAAVGTSPLNYDDFAEELTKVKGCAAALTACYLQESGRLTYDAELFEMLARQLHEAARYFEIVLGQL